MKQPHWSTLLYDRQHEIWPAWSRSEGDGPEAAAFLEIWLELRPGSAILDLGCGAGREVAALAARGHRVVGVDLSANLVRRAKQRLRDRGLDADVRVGDLLDLEERGSFDLIYFWDSTLNIFDLETARAVLARAARQLRPGGWLLTQQMHDAYWRAASSDPLRFEDAALGSSWTERRYRFDAGVLFDELVHFPEHGAAGEALPVQVLQLFPVAALRSALAASGLGEIRACGADGFSWARAGDVRDAAAMIAVAGRAPG